MTQRDKRRSESSALQDLQDELVAARKTHVGLINEQGHLKAEEQVNYIHYFDDI